MHDTADAGVMRCRTSQTLKRFTRRERWPSTASYSWKTSPAWTRRAPTGRSSCVAHAHEPIATRAAAGKMLQKCKASASVGAFLQGIQINHNCRSLGKMASLCAFLTREVTKASSGRMREQ